MAGTKGKGSTCAMVERMLRQAGYRTGLFTSPHLIDVRERIRINGWVRLRCGGGGGGEQRVLTARRIPMGDCQQPSSPTAGPSSHMGAVCGAVRSEPVDRATFLRNLWWCLERLEGRAADDGGKPAYFRFLTLLGAARCGSCCGRGHCAIFVYIATVLLSPLPPPESHRPRQLHVSPTPALPRPHPHPRTHTRTP